MSELDPDDLSLITRDIKDAVGLEELLYSYNLPFEIVGQNQVAMNQYAWKVFDEQASFDWLKHSVNLNRIIEAYSYRDSHYVYSAFAWARTKEGYNYWDDMYNVRRSFSDEDVDKLKSMEEDYLKFKKGSFDPFYD